VGVAVAAIHPQGVPSLRLERYPWLYQTPVPRWIAFDTFTHSHLAEWGRSMLRPYEESSRARSDARFFWEVGK
jgi:hypothetical protein